MKNKKEPPKRQELLPKPLLLKKSELDMNKKNNSELPRKQELLLKLLLLKKRSVSDKSRKELLLNKPKKLKD